MSRFWDHTGCILGCPQEAVGPYSFTTQLVGLGCFLMRLPKQPLGEMLSCWHPRWDLPSGAEAFAFFPSGFAWVWVQCWGGRGLCQPPALAPCCSAPPLVGRGVSAPVSTWQPASLQPPFFFQSRSVMSTIAMARMDLWEQVSRAVGLVQLWIHPCLKICCGSVPPGLPTLQERCHLGLYLRLSVFPPAGPGGSRASAGAPEFTFTFRSAHDVFRDFFGGRDPFAEFFGACGTGEAGSWASLCGAATELRDRAHSWLWQRVPTSVPCFWFTKLMG